MKLSNKLDKKTYGPGYREHILEQYKILVQSTEKVSDRRNSANNLYLGLNTALLTLIGVSTQIAELSWIRPLIFTVGIALSVIFWFLINSYKQLNTGKFEVLHKIESKLPLSIYKYEWYVLGEGKDKKKYLPFSHIELLIPIILGATYLILLLPYLKNMFGMFCRF